MDLNLEVAKEREKRPALLKSTLTINMAHENPEFHGRAHEAMLDVLHKQFPTMIFLGGVSDGEPFDHPEPGE
jgi:hypothetical protein